MKIASNAFILRRINFVDRTGYEYRMHIVNELEMVEIDHETLLRQKMLAIHAFHESINWN